MTSGHGGCGPHGLALAAWRRGFDVELFVNDEGPPFLDTVRDPDKKEVIRLVHEDFLDEIRRSQVKVHLHPFSADELSDRIAGGAIALVLISQYRIYGDKEPHWIIVSGCDQRFIYAHDPYISAAHVTSIDRVSIPILRREFELMAKYGRSKLRAAVILSRRGRCPLMQVMLSEQPPVRVPGSARFARLAAPDLHHAAGELSGALGAGGQPEPRLRLSRDRLLRLAARRGARPQGDPVGADDHRPRAQVALPVRAARAGRGAGQAADPAVGAAGRAAPPADRVRHPR